MHELFAISNSNLAFNDRRLKPHGTLCDEQDRNVPRKFTAWVVDVCRKGGLDRPRT